jgi:hypothetical protein
MTPLRFAAVIIAATIGITAGATAVSAWADVGHWPVYVAIGICLVGGQWLAAWRYEQDRRDQIDAEIVRRAEEEVKRDPSQLIRGDDLKRRLEQLQTQD